MMDPNCAPLDRLVYCEGADRDSYECPACQGNPEGVGAGYNDAGECEVCFGSGTCEMCPPSGPDCVEAA